MNSPNHLMLGSTLATVPGATVDWYCKGLMTFPCLLLGTEAQHQCKYNSCHNSVENATQGCTKNTNLYSELPSLFLSVHIQTFDRGSVPHVVPASTFDSICNIQGVSLVSYQLKSASYQSLQGLLNQPRHSIINTFIHAQRKFCSSKCSIQLTFKINKGICNE